jgi:hypothetical protein
MAAEPEDLQPMPIGNVTPTSRRNLLIGILGMALIAVFIHFQWMFMFGYFGPFGAVDYAMFIPRTIGSVLVAIGIFLSAFAWYEFKSYFNFRLAFYIAFFTLLTPWWGVFSELLIYSGLVMIPTGMYGSWEPGPLAPVAGGLVLVSSILFGSLMVLWAIALLYVRKNSRSPKLTLGASLIFLIIAHMTLLIIPLFFPSMFYYPYTGFIYSYYSMIPASIIEIGVILSGIFFYRLAASLKPY